MLKMSYLANCTNITDVSHLKSEIKNEINDYDKDLYKSKIEKMTKVANVFCIKTFT